MRQATPATQNELDFAEEAAATDREIVEDASLASFLQAAFSDNADPEQAAQQATQVPEQAAQQAARVPEQPGRYDPAGGSLWDDR